MNKAKRISRARAKAKEYRRRKRMTTVERVREKAASRACGDCQACCEALRVDFREDVRSEAGERCRYQCDAGCGIYETRPPGCQQYQCLWLAGYGTKADRPEMIGALFAQRDAPSDKRKALLRAVGADPGKHIMATILRRDYDADAVSRLIQKAWMFFGVIKVDEFRGIATVYGPHYPEGLMLWKGEDFR